MTTRKLSVALVAALSIALSACSSGGPSEAACQDPNISSATREACLDKARDVLREEIQKAPETRGD